MENIISYLKELGNKSFEEMPFNEVDALVLSQFVYLKFDGLVPKLTDNKESVFLYDMQAKMNEAVVFSDERYEKDNRLLFDAMVNSRRFFDMRCNYYANIIDEEVETQFCAMTCYLQGTIPVMVFRGTDENFVGWKEDFNMAFKKPVPGQQLSVLYMNQAGLRISDEFFVCGHSKGGNLAVYSSMNAVDDIQLRIRRIYSFDGPGFRPEILVSDDYEKIAPRIEKFIPKSSLVGMILENHEEYLVVDSSSVGLLQHNPYTWKVENAAFIRKDAVDKSQQLMNKTFNEWILKLDDNQLEVFINTLFFVLEGCDMKNLVEVSLDLKKSVNGMLRASKEISDETKETIHEIMKVLADILKENLKKL